MPRRGEVLGAILGDLRGRAVWVVAGALVCQLGLGFGYVIHPLAGEIMAELDWSRAELSFAQAPQLWVISLASPLIGALVLRVGARRVLVAATVLLGGVFLGLSRVEALWQFAALTVLMGCVVVGLGDITVGQVVTRWVVRSRGLALGLVYTGSNLGGFLLIRYSVRVADSQSWRVPLAHLSVLAIVLLLPAAFFLVRERKASPPLRSAGGADSESSSVVEAGGADDLALGAALRTRSFWILFATIFSFFFYFLGLTHHFVLFLTDAGMSRAEGARYLSAALGLGIVSKVVLGLLADRMRYRTAILLDYGLLALSSALLLWLPNAALIWPFVLAFGFATAARDVVYPLIIIECFGERYLAPIYGALMLAMAPGGSLGPVFAAAVHDQLGSYTLAFQVFAAVNAVAVLSLWSVRDERRGRSRRVDGGALG